MILAADNLTATHPPVAQALDRLDAAPIQELARRCEQAGARCLDLNPGYLGGRRADRLAFMVEAVQAVTDLPLILDSPEAPVLARGLAVCRGRPILNALTLEPRKLSEILPLAVSHDTDLVLLLLDERSMPPPDLEGKLALAAELGERAVSAGLQAQRLIFAPVLPNLSWPDACAQTGAVLRAVRWLAGGAVFGDPVRTMAGLSNLRSGFRRVYPPSLEAAVLAMLAGAGLTLALADALSPAVQEAFDLIRQMG
ncbi:MAG: dihydropteroate synthase [Deltaproteobacteria bacterium]|nr:dihydropteroate synthase [Deltaproteobacteria bacterium]